MDYTSGSSSLSMSGGDDFTAVNENLDRAVLLDTTQTISSAKTFGAGYTQQFDEGLEIASGKSVKGDALLNLNGITGTTLEVNSVDIISLDTTTTTLNNTTTNIQSGATTKFTTNASATTLNNTTTNIQSGATTKFTTNATDTALNNTTSLTLTHPTTSILSGASTKMTIGASDTTMDNTTTNIQSGATTKIAVAGTLTTLNNTTNTLSSGGTTKLTTNASTTTLNNTTTNIQSGGTTKFTQNASATTLTNQTITLDTTYTGEDEGIGEVKMIGDIYNFQSNDVSIEGETEYLTIQRRSFILDYTDGSALNTQAYPVEIVKCRDDPAGATCVGASTYIEITMKTDGAVSFNHEVFSGNFVAGGNTDITTMWDTKVGLHNDTEPHVMAIYSGSSSNNYQSFVIYLRAGYVYRIITDGSVGNYFRYISTTTGSPFFTPVSYRYWSKGGEGSTGTSITYAVGTNTTFAIVKTASTMADVLGVTANTETLYVSGQSSNSNFFEFATDTKISVHQSNSVQAHRGYYISDISTTPSATTLVPMVNITLPLTQFRANSYSSSQLVFSPNYDQNSTNNPQYQMMFPFKVRCVGFSITYDDDYGAGLDSPSFNFRLTMGSATGTSTTYLDETLVFPTGGLEGGLSLAHDTAFNNDKVIPYFTTFYAHATYKLASDGTTNYNFASEYTIYAYFQQVF